MKSLKEYLQKKQKEEKKLIQVRIRKELVDAAQLKLTANGLKWSQFIEASLRRFLDEEL